MPFEVFENKGSHTGRATVRFLSKGRVHFNAAAARMLGDITHVRLLWDSDTSRVGFEPAHQDDPNAFKLTRSSSQIVLSAAAFASAFPIPIGQRMLLEQDGGMFIAQIPSATPSQSE